MTHPVVLRYTEGAETYDVNAAGHIGRPAIGMAPSGRWRFAGVANGHGSRLYDLPGLLRALASDSAVPNKLYVQDVDCGTFRIHGRPADRLWIVPGADVELVERLQAERLASEAAKREAERVERVRVAESGRELWRDSRYGIALIERGRSAARFIVRDGDQATERLEATAAASALGFAIMEAAQNEESGA